MPVLLSDEELNALSGITDIQYRLYISGIRRYMDYATGITGIKRKISYQSLSEEIYIEPIRGVKNTGSKSRQQIRRAVKALEKAGLIAIKSTSDNLILQCLLAKTDNSIQNKADTKPTHLANTQADTLENKEKHYKNSIGQLTSESKADTQADTPKNGKADTPPVSDNYTKLNYTGELNFLKPEEIPYFKLFQDLKLNVAAKNYLSAIAVAKALVKAKVPLETVSQAISVKLTAYYEEKGTGASTPVPDYFKDAILEHHRKILAIEQQPQEMITDEKPNRVAKQSFTKRRWESLHEQGLRELEESKVKPHGK